MNTNKFCWGTATSAFQIEGKIENDFTDWEKLAKFDITSPLSKYENGSDHWDNWRNDFDLLKDLGLNSYRFSIEWARIEPERNKYSEEAIMQYSEMIDYLIELGITPFLTLHHFTHPRWFHENTPWHTEESITAFTDFAKIIIDLFADRVNYWISFNEPIVWALAAYGDAKFPPGKHDLNAMMDVIFNMMKSHAVIYDYLKLRNPTAQLGIAKHFIKFKEGRRWFFIDKKITENVDYFFNQMLLNAFEHNRIYHWLPTILNFDKRIDLNNKIDFWGINYYYKIYSQLKLSLRNPIYLFPKKPATDMGWEIHPKGLKQAIKRVAKTGKDIYITENGIATNDDELRISFIKKHLRVIRKMANKYKVKGYFYWSLLDNYEWLEGKSKRFGLVHVDYENNFNRTIKHSGLYYKKMIETIEKKWLDKKIKDQLNKQSNEDEVIK